MQQNFGYKDGAGTWYVTVDTDACDACTGRDGVRCVDVCPADLWELTENEFEILSEEMVAAIKGDRENDLRYDCSPCKSPNPDAQDSGTAKCAEACPTDAIEFSW